MRRRRNGALTALVALLACAACVPLKRSSEARFFVLRSLAEPQRDASEGLPAHTVGVSPVRLPGYLRRPQIVTWSGPHGLQIDEFERWAEPLEEGVSRVLAEDLAARLPGHRVVRHPWPASLALRCRIALELERFSAGDDGVVRLVGRWAVVDARGRPLVSAPASLETGPVAAGPRGADPGAAVAALSELLATLAGEIALAVEALPDSAGPG
jgi:hypothetical protein